MASKRESKLLGSATEFDVASSVGILVGPEEVVAFVLPRWLFRSDHPRIWRGLARQGTQVCVQYVVHQIALSAIFFRLV